MVPGAFDVVSLFYCVFALFVIVRLYRRGAATFDDTLTGDDARIIGATAFYIGTPIVVALHELGHAVAAWAVGGHIEEAHFLAYWGYVIPARTPPFLPWEDALIAAAGNLVSLAIGFGAIASVLIRPKNAAWNLLRIELGRQVLGLTLVLYPVLSVLMRNFDFWILRESLNAQAPYVGDGVLLGYLVAASLLWWRWRVRWSEQIGRLASPLYDPERKLRAAIARDPENADAWRELGRVFLAGERPAEAMDALEQARKKHRDPEIDYLLGVAWMKSGNPRVAADHLRSAGQALEHVPAGSRRDDLEFDVTLALTAARLGLGDPEGALITAEAAAESRPRDIRVILLLSDALRAVGRRDEASDRLRAALPLADDAYAAEIRKRLGI